MTTCVRHLVVQSRQYGQMTVYPEDGYRRFRVVWFWRGRLHSPSLNKATLLAFLERVEGDGGTVTEEFDWGHDPSDLDQD
jgi:hypothetical protein